VTEGTLTEPALAGLIARLADNKCLLGRRYAEWCTAAPTLESAVAAASMAQDEIGHARSFYPVLREVAGPSPEHETETRTQWTNTAFLNCAFEGWTDFVAANFLFDTALSVLLESATDSTFNPLAQRARRILEEEPLHWLHGEGWVRRLAQKGAGVKVALQRSLDRVTSESLAWFDVAGPQLVSDAVLRTGADGLRDTFRARVNPVLAAVDLTTV
jgi:phenylacetate-CoA oxygenase PaaI subunit